MPPGYSSGLVSISFDPHAEHFRWRRPRLGTGVLAGNARVPGLTSTSRQHALQYTHNSLPSRIRSPRVTGITEYSKSGREDNIYWRRIKDEKNGLIEAAGARALVAGDVVPLGKDIIHSVTNPIMKLSGAIHVYGGDFFELERSEWDRKSSTERRRSAPASGEPVR